MTDRFTEQLTDRATVVLRDSDGRDHPLADRVVLGRDPSCDLVLADGSVSREHAVVEVREQRWLVQDRGSRNGTTVNEHRLPPGFEQPLRDGDRVCLGSVLVTFLAPGQRADPDRTSSTVLPTPQQQVHLSPYQLQVVRLLASPWAQGLEPASNTAIAAQLGTPAAVDAVKQALRRIYEKTSLADAAVQTKRRSLCRIARTQGWLDPT